MTSNPFKTKTNLDVITPDTMQALQNYKQKYYKARMVDFLKVINYDIKIKNTKDYFDYIFSFQASLPSL